MKAVGPPDFIESDELREARARSKARRLGYKVERDQSGYRLLRVVPAKDELIDDGLSLDQLEEYLDRYEDEDPIKLIQDIVAENPGVTEEQHRRLFMDELRSSEKLREIVAKETFAMLFREAQKDEKN